MKPFRLMIALAVGAVAGCASVPAPLEGDYSESFYPDQATDRSVGANVRWGGVVVETRPESRRTCIEILAQELDRTARPVRSDREYGRFIACRNEFIDPEIFVNGREVTVAGELTGFREAQFLPLGQPSDGFKESRSFRHSGGVIAWRPLLAANGGS